MARWPIVLDDRDRAAFVRRLRETVARFDRVLHAWCLMDNHFHPVVQSRLEQLSRGMHQLNFRHAQRFNERYDRVGHLFQDRFGARVVVGDTHLGDTCRYVEKQPRSRRRLLDCRGVAVEQRGRAGAGALSRR